MEIDMSTDLDKIERALKNTLLALKDAVDLLEGLESALQSVDNMKAGGKK